MFYNFRHLKHKIIYIWLLGLIIPNVCSQGQTETLLEDYIARNTSFPFEKVYLHLDRPNYIQGDTIWFKAYLWFGYDQIPDTLSGVLYVDLLNPVGGVEQKRKLLIQNGTSYGDFSLGINIMPGRYTLRAYTRWMQNLNTGEPFYQTVTISPKFLNFQVECTPIILKQAGNDSLKVSFRFFEMNQTGELNSADNHKVNYSLKIGEDLLQSGNVLAANTREQVVKYRLSGIGENDTVAIFGLSIQDDRLTFEKQFRIPLNEPVDLQFFSEGGKLVNGLKSKVAFKAIGTDGLSREVTGVIKDNSEEVVTSFESIHKGMGAFHLKPESEKKYSAHIMFNNRLYIIPLPPALEEGSNMAVTIPGGNNNLFMTIRYRLSMADTIKYVAGSAYGKVRFAIPVKTTGDSCLLQIPLNLFPEGVSRLTVLNGDFKPECERLLYINRSQRFKVEVEPDSSSYGTRSKVTLSIKSTTTGGIPVQTDLSLAVVDKEQISEDEEITSICAYKLLQSELKGHIEDADYYFRDDSIIDQNKLDLLMLTQGYRKFLPVGTNPEVQKFQPERTFNITGNIKLPGKGKRAKKYDYHDIGLTLLSASEPTYIELSNPDSLGKFSFHIPLVRGKSNSILQATFPKGKPFYGDIYLDEPAVAPKFPMPPLTVNKLTTLEVENIHHLQAVKKAELSKSPWDTSMSVSLGEVTVTAKAKNWYRNFEKEAEKIADLDSLDPTGGKYRNIYDLLVQEFGARYYFLSGVNLKTVTLPCVSIKGPSDWFPIYVINGKTFFNAAEHGEIFVGLLNTLSALKVNEIKKIMVLPPGNIPSYYAGDLFYLGGISQSLVVIETYSNNTFRGDPVGIKTFILKGLDAPRVFYSPRYEGSNRKGAGYDGRATLFWEPSIKTDADGQAKVEFFTSDRQTGLEVIVNGIEVGSGNPGLGQALIISTLKEFKK